IRDVRFVKFVLLVGCICTSIVLNSISMVASAL
ncbi:unnamed protein product, partial [Allacma fusca]